MPVAAARYVPHLDPDATLAADAGVLSREEASKRPESRRRVRSGAWKAYGDVVVTHNGPLTEDQKAWVALLRAGPGAVLAAAWAMRAHGVQIEVPDRPQLVVPARRSRPFVPDADVRRSRLLGSVHVHPVRQPPALRLARATLDATSLCRVPDDVRALLCAPVQQRRLQVQSLRDSLALLGPLTGRSLVLATLDDLELGAQSIHELRFARGLRRRDLPPPERQTMGRRADGRSFLDCWWERYRLHVEIDGLAHLWMHNWLADLFRANELEIGTAATRLRFAGHQLLEREQLVFDQVERALFARGWRRGA